MRSQLNCLRACVASLGLWSAATHAQIRPYGVVEAGAERRKVLTDAERIAPVPGIDGPRNHKDGVAYGVAIGVEAAVSSNLFIGAEANVARSENNTAADQFRGIQLSPALLIGVNERTEVHPRWSYAVTARAGINLSRSIALYGLAGVGGERVRRDFEPGDAGLGNTTTLRRNQSFDSFTYGAGARIFLSDRVGLRAEYRRIDADDGYKPQRLMAGLMFRL